MEYAIETVSLCKYYKNVKAVDGVNLKIRRGEFVTILGENGAGKSTLIKVLSGISEKTSGKAYVLGYDTDTDKDKISEILNFSPQETAVSNNLTVKENIELICGLYGFDKLSTKNKEKELIEKLKLKDVENKKAKNLSGGYQRRLSIALALINEPKVLFLDEPTLGLDVKIRRDLWSVIRELKGFSTLILTTHYLEEVETLSDKVYIMDKGKIIVSGTSEELKTQTKTESLEDAFIKITGGTESE